jgi:hypothetical protein
MSDDKLNAQHYACAIGSAILALNTAESELSELLLQLGRGPEIEAWLFAQKVKALEEHATKESDQAVRAKYDRIIAEARRLADERNNFAHSLLWFNPTDGEHQRRFVRWVGPKGARHLTIEHDTRSPQEIIEFGLQIDALALDIGALATELRNR